MALLGATSLTGCNSIPQFIPGLADVGVTTTAASRTIFRMATSPVSWTKDTTAFDGMLRITNAASLSPGGSLNFPAVFTSSFPSSLTFDQQPIGLTVTAAAAFSTPSVTSGPGGNTTTQPATLSLTQVTQHSHQYTAVASGFIGPGVTANIAAQVAAAPSPTTAAGGGGSHFHTIQVHTHNVGTVNGSDYLPHTHPTAGTNHTHTVTTTQSFNVNYVDMIISIKN